MNENKIFTICVPTFNRGTLALKLVEKILPDIENNWEILILDNASISEVDYYNKINEISKQNNNLRYIRHDANCFFSGNYLACLELATTPYIMILSDEDMPNIENLKLEIPLLMENKNIGILRGSIESQDGINRGNCIAFENDIYLKVGSNTLTQYGMLNNYFSGTIYNREKAEELGLFEKLRKNLKKQEIYPHLYFELLLMATADVKIISMGLSFEGVPYFIKYENGCETGILIYQAPYSYGSRIDQFVALRDALYEAVDLINNKEFDDLLFINLYINLVNKYFHLVGAVNAPLYIKNELNTEILKESFYYLCCASIVDYKEFDKYREQIIPELTKIYTKNMRK